MTDKLLKDLFDGVIQELMDAKADLLFDPRVENMEDGDAADHLLLTVAALDTAMCHLRMSARMLK